MDERDPLLSQTYRAAEHPEPPAALDARILAAARQAVAAPRRRRPWFAWAVPMSTAAVLVVAVSLILKEYREAPETIVDRNPARATRPARSSPPRAGFRARPCARNTASQVSRGTASATTGWPSRAAKAARRSSSSTV